MDYENPSNSLISMLSEIKTFLQNENSHAFMIVKRDGFLTYRNFDHKPIFVEGVEDQDGEEVQGVEQEMDNALTVDVIMPDGVRTVAAHYEMGGIHSQVARMARPIPDPIPGYDIMETLDGKFVAVENGKVTDLFDYGERAHKLARRDGPSTSKTAAMSVDTTKLEEIVHKAIRLYGHEGCIASDLLERFSTYPYSSITARFSALERKGLISCGPDKRKGPSGRQQRVMRATFT